MISQVLKRKIFALTLVFVVLTIASCSQKPNADSVRLDGFLSRSMIDRVDLVSFSPKSNAQTFSTNTLKGPEAAKFVASLMKTNRIDSPDTTKDQIELRAHLMDGTNILCFLDLFESGIWRIGDYSFRTRNAP
jgi:hypothetical protein